MNVLAIDQGTSGTKAMVVNDHGEIIGLSETPLSPSYLQGGGVEQDPHGLLDSVLSAGRVAMDQAKVEIAIVALANQGESVLAWDRDTGQPLSNIIVWQDRRAEVVCKRLGSYAELIAEKTGLVLDPYFSAPKQAWLRSNVTSQGVVTTSDTWLIYQLTGEFVTDITTASRSLVCNLESGNWDPALLQLFGLANESLPRILSCDEVAGVTDAFGGKIPVGGLVVDQQAALIGESCLEPGEAKCTFGTGAFLLANLGAEPTRSNSGLATSVAWRTRGEIAYCFDGQVYTAASAIRWLQTLGFIESAEDLDRVAAAENEGVFCVPAFAGLAAPWWRSDARASFSGLNLSTTSGHLVLAVLEGIAAQVSQLAELVAKDTGHRFHRLRVDGGLTQSARLVQAVSDLIQIPVDVYPSPHATPLGAVALARMALEPSLNMSDALVAWHPSQTYKPIWSSEKACEHNAKWKAEAAALR